jgi:hypothetical protein
MLFVLSVELTSLHTRYNCQQQIRACRAIVRISHCCNRSAGTATAHTNQHIQLLVLCVCASLLQHTYSRATATVLLLLLLLLQATRFLFLSFSTTEMKYTLLMTVAQLTVIAAIAFNRTDFFALLVCMTAILLLLLCSILSYE